MTTFSQRHGFEPPPPEITIRHDAPLELRGIVIDIAYECGMDPHGMRSLVCRKLRVREDPSNWSAFPNVDGEVRGHMDGCEWYRVYDIIEAIASSLTTKGTRPENAALRFERELNAYFIERGIGWQLKSGLIEVRGPEAFENAVAEAARELERAGRPTAMKEIHEALRDLSRRPTPDLTGAMQHGVAALECIVRDVTADPKSTLGALLSRHADVVPAPLDKALEKLWGYASEMGRHLREGREPAAEEVELAVHLSAAVSAYLAKKLPTQVTTPRTAGLPPVAPWDDDDLPF